MKFGQTEIPEAIFNLARAYMRSVDRFTPEDIRQHLRANAQAELAAVHAIPENQWIVAHRVTRACIDELRASGEIAQVKNGLWARLLATPTAKPTTE